MTTVKGRASAGNRGLRGILIEAFDAPAKFQTCLPLGGRKDLNKHSLRRLGSAITDAAIDYQISGKAPDYHLSVISSPIKENNDLDTIYE